MEKYIFDERNSLWYELQGDYYLPCLKLPEEEQQPIGIWGQRHLRYIKQHRKVLYTNLLTSGKLNGYLSGIDKQADDMFSRLVKQMAEREGVTEQLKADNQMEWIARMNNIRSRASEIIHAEYIFYKVKQLIVFVNKSRNILCSAEISLLKNQIAIPFLF